MSELGDDRIAVVEAELTEAMQRSASSEPVDVEALMERARRQLALRDVLSFSFAHLLQTFLVLFVSVYNRGRSDEQSDVS